MSGELARAKESMRMAVDRVTTDEGLSDWNLSGDAELDAKRLDLINELGRQLSPNESFNIEAGLPHDYRPPELPKREPDAEMLHPEESLRRGAR